MVSAPRGHTWASIPVLVTSTSVRLPAVELASPAPPKNALDFLYHEWAGKPAALVTHGTRGVGRAAEQLHEVLLGLRMRPLEPHLLSSIAEDAVVDYAEFLDATTTLAPYPVDGRALAAAPDIALAG